jgi:3-(3-hydroxy-phenyl)propionate hydroxylase
VSSDAAVPVGIVGAGPVGLVTAARLASAGIPSVILELEPALRKQGSKACLIQGDVLEVLDKFGCARQIGREGVTWTVARTYVRDREIRRAEYPRGLGYGPFVNISQYRIEQLLVRHVEADPLCRILWGHAVTGVRQDAGAVTLEVETPHGPQDFRFDYAVACDGVRSPLRTMTGVAWTGYTHKDRFLITDLKVELPLAKERHFHYDPGSNPGRQLVMHPQPDEIWRIDWQLPPDADIEAERASGAFDRRVRAVIGDIPYEVDWLSTYRFHQRVVERFRLGRLFFAGDAAHSLPPYGSRGMNSGIQDADNLAWKLAMKLHGEADDALLDTYHEERYPAALENLRITEATIRFMVPPNRLRRLSRRVLLRLSSRLPSARDRVNSGKMAEPYIYSASSIVDCQERHPLLGRFAPDAAIRADGPTRLRELFGHGFTGLCFFTGRRYTGDAGARGAVDFALRALAAAPPSAAMVLVFDSPDTVAGLRELPASITALADPDGKLRQTYRADRPLCFAVRPDGHLGAVVDHLEHAEPMSFAASVARCSASDRACLPHYADKD